RRDVLLGDFNGLRAASSLSRQPINVSVRIDRRRRVARGKQLFENVAVRAGEVRRLHRSAALQPRAWSAESGEPAHALDLDSGHLAIVRRSLNVQRPTVVQPVFTACNTFGFFANSCVAT